MYSIDVNAMNNSQKLKLLNVAMQGEAMERILKRSDDSTSSSNALSDGYITQSGDEVSYLNYTKESTLQGCSSVSKEEIWEYLADFGGAISSTNGFTVNGCQCYLSQIEKMDSSVLQEIKAVDNVITLETGVYYGITTNDGGEERQWGFCVKGNGKLKIAGSELFYTGQIGIKTTEIGSWNLFFGFLINGDNSSIGLTLEFSQDEIHSRLAELGFTPGWCTIVVDGVENTFYYSNTGYVYSKEQYDAAYIGMTEFNHLNIYSVGDEFNYNGTIYTVDEEGHINIPYGEDLFNCLSYPINKLQLSMMS